MNAPPPSAPSAGAGTARHLARVVEAGDCDDVSVRLEEGDVVLLPEGLPEPLPPEDLAFLHDELGPRLSAKNISYLPHGAPSAARISGLRGARALRRRAAEILARYGAGVEAALGPLVPRWREAWRRGKINYRPLQEQGRDLPLRSSNERLHVDAFASGATHGDRVLRVFTNLHPHEPRVWRSAGRFDDLWRARGEGARVTATLPDRIALGALRGLGALGLPWAILLESSPYDRAMRRFHNALKVDEDLDADHRHQVRLELPPGRTWAVLTDGVSHAVVRGERALVATFHVPLSACARPELAPIRVMADRGARR